MTQERCEDVTLALMAIADGEEPILSAGLVTAHLERCTLCSDVVKQVNALATLLDGHKRREQSADLWPSIEAQLETATSQASPAETMRKWPAFLALALLLVIYKLVEMIPERDLGLFFKLVPLVFVIIVFGYMKENPFRVNPGLTLEGDR